MLIIFYAIFTFVRLEIFKMLLGSFFPLALLILGVLGRSSWVWRPRPRRRRWDRSEGCSWRMEVIRNRLQKFWEKVEEKNSLACVSLVAKILVQVGYPPEEILKAAEDEGCDLIVLGNHGKGFLRQTFLGSVSRSVLDRSREPVSLSLCPPKQLHLGMKGEGI